MNRRPEKERLLADILAEQSEAEFREALLSQALRRVRRRRRFVQARRSAAGIALLVCLALLGWRFLPSSRAPVSVSSIRHYTLVQTIPLSPEEVVTSRPVSATVLVSSSPAATVVITSANRPEVPEITDTQLLELVAPSVAALIRPAGQNAELIFANPADRDLFLHN